MIKTHRETEFPAYVSDYLPTFLDVLGMKHPHPEWAADGESLMPLIRQGASAPAEQVNLVANRSTWLGFELGEQVALIDNEWKLVIKPAKGQCKTMLPPYNKPGSQAGPFLFNLVEDPTESHDLSESQPQRFSAMVQAANRFQASIRRSQVVESQCKSASPGPGPSPPGPQPGPLPGPTPPKCSSCFALHPVDNTSKCLTLKTLAKHAHVIEGACNAGSMWTLTTQGELATASPAADLQGDILKLDYMGNQGAACKAGSPVWPGSKAAGAAGVRISADGQLELKSCTDMCATLVRETLVVGACAGATRFSKIGSV